LGWGFGIGGVLRKADLQSPKDWVLRDSPQEGVFGDFCILKKAFCLIFGLLED